MSHGSFEREGMELGTVARNCPSVVAYASQNPRKIEKKFENGFAHYWHQFENPYGNQNVQKQILYNLRVKKILPTHHSPTQN